MAFTKGLEKTASWKLGKLKQIASKGFNKIKSNFDAQSPLKQKKIQDKATKLEDFILASKKKMYGIKEKK